MFNLVSVSIYQHPWCFLLFDLQRRQTHLYSDALIARNIFCLSSLQFYCIDNYIIVNINIQVNVLRWRIIIIFRRVFYLLWPPSPPQRKASWCGPLKGGFTYSRYYIRSIWRIFSPFGIPLFKSFPMLLKRVLTCILLPQ